MKLLPGDSFAIATDLPEAEVVERLRARVSGASIPRWRRARRDFVGDVSGDGFVVRPAVGVHAALLPEFHGRTTRRGDATFVAVQVVPNVAVLAVVTLLIGAQGVLIFDHWPRILVTAVVHAVLAWFFALCGFWFDGGSSRRKLARILQGQVVPVDAAALAAVSESRTSSGIRRWSLPLLFGVATLSAGLLVGLQSGLFEFTEQPSADFHYILWACQTVGFLWLAFASGLGPFARLKWLGVVLAVEMAVYLAVGVDGYAGDGRVILAWRWTSTPEERFAASRRDGPVVAEAAAPVVDLARESPTDFPSFRGRDRSGIVTGTRLARDWAARPPRELWRQPVGRGWSSFVVAGEYCVTQEQRDEDEAVVCYELRTGRECWVHRDRARFFEYTSGAGPRATPTIHRGRVYALGATGLLNCLDGGTGRPIWSVDILASNGVENRLFGMVGSPLIVGETVIVAPGGPHASLAAYHVEDGRRLWGGGSTESSYASPHFVELAGRPQVLNFNAEGLFSHDLSDGRVLWSIPWISNPEERNNVCQPVPLAAERRDEDDGVFVASGYSKGCARFAVSQTDEGFAVRRVWETRNLKAKFSSVVRRGDHVYGLDERILTCVDLRTGERTWKGGRYGYGQLLRVEDLLLVQAEEGEVVLVDAVPDGFRERARFAALGDRTWNHPAVSGRILVVRNDREAACFELPVE